MFERRGKSLDAKLDLTIEAVLDQMLEYGVESEEHKAQMDNLDKLMAIRDKNARKPISLDVIVTTGGMLLGIGIMVAYEQNHPFTSKAISLLQKPFK